MIRLIVAYDQQRGIAKHGFQPWNIPDDEAYFMRQTKLFGARVLMGRTTHNVIGEPLPERDNFVVTSSKNSIDGVVVVNDLATFLQEQVGKDLWVVGGASVYKKVIELGMADEIYVTHIDADFGCDQFFVDFSEEHYQLQSKSDPAVQNGFTYSYAVYVKK